MVHTSQPGWIPAQRIQRELVGYIMGWHLPPPFGPSEILLISFQGPHRVSYRDLLLGDDSGKWLSFCLAKVGSFGQWFPNILTRLQPRCSSNIPGMDQPHGLCTDCSLCPEWSSRKSLLFLVVFLALKTVPSTQ